MVSMDEAPPHVLGPPKFESEIKNSNGPMVVEIIENNGPVTAVTRPSDIQ